jgi:beta-galactosidase
LGIAIEEYEALAGDLTYPAEGKDCLPGTWTARYWADWTQPRGAETLASFKPWHMKEYALATRHRAGKGWGYYVSSPVAEDSFYDKLMEDVCVKAGVSAPIVPPAGVEVCTRTGVKGTLVFLINHTEEEKTVGVPSGKTDLLTGRNTAGPLRLDRFGVAVLDWE